MSNLIIYKTFYFHFKQISSDKYILFVPNALSLIFNSIFYYKVNIEIEDVNDNAPEFESSTVRISVPENVDIGTPLYAVHARDRDSGSNGVIRYKIVNTASNAGLFDVDSKTGHLTLRKHLDYEMTQRHSLVVTATDTGTPPLSANLTILVEVQDVNDNPPVFERADYSIKVMETLPVNSQVKLRMELYS